MKSSASSNEQDEERQEKRPEVNLDPTDTADADELNRSRTTEGQQTLITPDDKLPEGPLTDQERHLIYEKGIKFKKKGSYQHALYCLLACVRGLKEGSDFPQLPECLHNIAEIYSKLEDYENAVSFAQAEKLYYETSLISVSNESQQEPDGQSPKVNTGSSSATDKGTESKASQPENKDDPQGSSAEARSANEYEKLAHMCLKQKNAQLALEYCGKAVKLRQSIYGEEHPVTKRTLDLFTVIYAEMGKEQYSAAMQKFHETKQSEETVPEEAAKTSESAKPIKESTDEKDKLAVESRESPVGETQEDERNTDTPTLTENNVRVGLSPGQAMFCFFLLTAAVAVGVTLLCCHVTGKDPVTTFKYMVTRMKFYYYYYMKRAPVGNKYF